MGIMSSTMLITAMANSGSVTPTISAVPIEGQRVCQQEMVAYAKQFPNVVDLVENGDTVSFTVRLPYNGPNTLFYLRCQARR